MKALIKRLLRESLNRMLNQKETANYLKSKNEKWVKVRAGLPRTDNSGKVVASMGARHGKVIEEVGVSYFDAEYSPSNGWIAIKSSALADYYTVAGKRPFYLIEGESKDSEGLSGEDLLDPKTVKVIGELNPNKIVEEVEFLTAAGNEINRRVMCREHNMCVKTFKDLPADLNKIIYDEWWK